MNFDDLTSDFEIAPEGPATATLVSWIDRGVQAGKFGSRRQAALRFELPDVETKNDEPCLVFATVFNLSLRSKNFREMAVALMGKDELKGTPLRDMLGKSCKVTIVHRESDGGQVYANIATYKALKKGTKVMAHQSHLVFFSLDLADVPSLADLKTAVEALPDGERTRVQASETYKELLATLSNTAAKKGKPAAEIIDDGFPADLSA